MLDHHRVMTHDVFSYTVLGERWATPEWGYDVVLAQAVRSLGPVAFWVLSAGLALLTILVLAVRSRLVGAGWTWTGLLCIEVGAAITLYLDDRPQMFSYLFVALLLLLLTLARRRRWWLCPVPVMFVLWANLHGSFPLGLAILLLEVMVTLVRPRWGRVSVRDPLPRGPIVATLVASGAATLLNPFGLGVYSSALGITFNQQVRALVVEWQSPDFHDPATLAVVAIPVAITVAYLAVSKRDVPRRRAGVGRVPARVEPGGGTLHPVLRHRMVCPGGELSPCRGGEPAPEPAGVAPGGGARGVLVARPVVPGRHAGTERPGPGCVISPAPPGPDLLDLSVE